MKRHRRVQTLEKLGLVKTQNKFALFDFLGRPKGYYAVETEELEAPKPSPTQEIGHFIFIADASGSMYYDMKALREMVEKLLTLESYRDCDALTSVISFSTKGDCPWHVRRASIKHEIMQPGSSNIEEIRKLRARGLTCISQALERAKELIQPNERTAVVLLSDGYANHLSPYDERMRIGALVNEYKAMPNVFVNTIALRSWVDFQLLSFIANEASGAAFHCPHVEDVYEILHSGMDLVLGADAAPSAVKLPLGAADYQAFSTKGGRKVFGGKEDLTARGLKAKDDKTVYRFTELDAESFGRLNVSVCGEDETSLDPVYAFVKTNLAEGNINRAKYALVATRNQTLLGRHARALVGSEISDFGNDVEMCLYESTPQSHAFSTQYALNGADKASVLDIVKILNSDARSLKVNLPALRDGYMKRGVKRINGTRDKEGNFTPCAFSTKFKDAKEEFISINGFELNRNNATINMLISRPIELLKGKRVIKKVAGLDLDLKGYNNYTIVGDGLLNVKSLNLQISSKKVFRKLEKTGAVSGKYKAGASYDVSLEGRPLVPYTMKFDADDLEGVFDRILRLKVVASILAACTKGTSDELTAEQIAALKDHYVSPKMYLSLPSTTEYADKEKALNDGIIDTRLSYKVDIGSQDILSPSALYSANAFLNRHFVLFGETTKIKKPKFDDWREGATAECKVLSARTKLVPVDDVMKPIFEDFLAIGCAGEIGRVLSPEGISTSGLYDVILGRMDDAEERTETLLELKYEVDEALETLYQDIVCPLAFYIGASGIVPDDFETQALDADTIAAKHPNLKIGKPQREGFFYPLANGVLLSVYVKSEYFSTGREIK